MEMFDFLTKLKSKMDKGQVSNLAEQCRKARKDVFISTFLRSSGMVSKNAYGCYSWQAGDITQWTAEYVREWTNYIKNG